MSLTYNQVAWERVDADGKSPDSVLWEELAYTGTNRWQYVVDVAVGLVRFVEVFEQWEDEAGGECEQWKQIS
jgi:hypothetical protein